MRAYVLREVMVYKRKCFVGGQEDTSYTRKGFTGGYVL